MLGLLFINVSKMGPWSCIEGYGCHGYNHEPSWRPVYVRLSLHHDDVIKWKYFSRYWPFVNSPHKGQRRGALMFSLICARINGSVNNREAGDLRRHRAHCDVIVMLLGIILNRLRLEKQILRPYSWYRVRGCKRAYDNYVRFKLYDFMSLAVVYTNWSWVMGV